MNSKWSARTILAILLSASVANFCEGGPPQIENVEWIPTPDGASGRLTVRLDSPTNAMEAMATLRGVELRLEGVRAGGAGSGEVRIESEEGAARVILESPGASLAAVTIHGRTLDLDVWLGGASVERRSGYRLGVGDVVTLSVYKNPDLSGDFPVEPDGTVNFPLIGGVRAAGLTDQDLAQHLTRILASDYLVDPKLSLSVKSYQSQFAYVTGAVPKSTRVALRPGMTLQDVLSEAGVALAAGQEVVMSRTGQEGKRTVLDAAAIAAAEAPEPEDGDLLVVGEPRYVFIYGEVRRPGRFVLAEGLSLIQAITLAEGLTDWASRKEIRILRKAGEGTEEISVNLADVENRKVEDPLLQPGDVVRVRRRILKGVLGDSLYVSAPDRIFGFSESSWKVMHAGQRTWRRGSVGCTARSSTPRLLEDPVARALRGPRDLHHDRGADRGSALVRVPAL